MKLNFNIKKHNKVFKKDKFLINPNIYWLGLVSFSLFLIFIAFVFGYLFFKNISSKNYQAENSSEGSKILNQERLQKALDNLNKRDQVSKEILEKEMFIQDPSL